MIMRMRDMMKRKNSQKGFTLVELIVVMAILAVLSAIAVPRYTGVQETAKERAHAANVQTLTSAATMYLAEHGNPTAAVSATAAAPGVLASYIQTWPTDPWSRDATVYTVGITTAGVISVTGVSDPTP
jgi:prepilin-type N-terminal cleavage/methylation domain-containing protein